MMLLKLLHLNILKFIRDAVAVYTPELESWLHMDALCVLRWKFLGNLSRNYAGVDCDFE